MTRKPNPDAQRLGRRGGKKRMASLSAEERKALASKGGKARAANMAKRAR